MKRFFLLNLVLGAGTIAVVLALYFFSTRQHEDALQREFSGAASELCVDDTPAARFDGRQYPAERVRSTPFRLAVAPIASPESSLNLYSDLAKYIGRKLNREDQLILRSTYAEINEVLRNRQCDAAFVCVYAFMRGEKEFGMRAIAIPVIHGNRTYHSFIIVPSGSPAQSLLDLKDRRFASADILSLSGWVYAALQIRRAGFDPSRFFREHVFTGSHDRTVLAVANGMADGAAVDHIIYEQMPEAVRAKLRVVEKSPPFGHPPFCVHPDADPAIVSRIQSILTGMHETAEGAAVLAALDMDRFEVPQPDLYQSVRDLVREWESR